MIHLDLTLEEQQFLTLMLNEQLSDLRFEIADTDDRDYKKMLKDRKKLVEDLLTKVKPVEAVSQHS